MQQSRAGQEWGDFLCLCTRCTADPSYSSQVMGTRNSVHGHQIWITDLHGAKAESMHKRASSHLGPEQLLYSLLGCTRWFGGSFVSLQQIKYGKGFLFPLGSIKYQLWDVSLVKGLRLRVLTPPFPTQDTSSLSHSLLLSPLLCIKNSRDTELKLSVLKLWNTHCSSKISVATMLGMPTAHKAVYPNPALHTPPPPGQKPTPQAAQHCLIKPHTANPHDYLQKTKESK